MTIRKCLILNGVLATFLAACSGAAGDDDGGGSDFLEFSGAYTLTYQRVQSNSNCTTEDPDWIQGILILGDGGEFDFGTTYQVDAEKTGPDTYAFDADLSDGTGLTHVSGVGTFVDSSGSLQIAGGDDDGIVADYTTDCRVRGTYFGARTSPSEARVGVRGRSPWKPCCSFGP